MRAKKSFASEIFTLALFWLVFILLKLIVLLLVLRVKLCIRASSFNHPHLPRNQEGTIS